MGSRLSKSLVPAFTVGVGAGPVTVAIVSSGVVAQEFDSQPILICWYVLYPAGVTGPNAAYQIRRGVGTGGTQISGFAGIQEANSTGIMRSGITVDVLGGLNTLAYSLVINTANANNAFTVTEAMIAVMVL